MPHAHNTKGNARKRPQAADAPIEKTSASSNTILMMGLVANMPQAEQEALDRVLENNRPVGVLMGTYETGLPITQISNFFLANLGYELAEYSNNKHHSLLSYVYEGDQAFFTSATFQNFEGHFEFRMQNKAGECLYTYAYKTNYAAPDGTPCWMLSTRVSRETVATHQLIHGLDRLIARYVICDVATNEFAYFICGQDEAYMTQGVYARFVDGMVDQLGVSADLDALDQEMSPANICEQLKAHDGLYRYDYADDATESYYRMSVMPLEYDADGNLAKYLVLVMDVTRAHIEEMRARQSLIESYQAATQASEAKTQFLSNMSHDIRTPMNAIIGMTAIAGAHVDDRDRVLDALGKITISSRHLLGLINEVLDMSRIERGKMALNNEEFSMPELVDNMIQMIKPSVVAREQDFDVRVKDLKHEDVIGDSLRIQQVFTNIMGNAVKYTPEGGSIKLSIAEKPTRQPGLGCYEFVVADTGIGMSEDFVKRVYEPFSRAENADTTGAQGTGLGMSIAKSIIEMMGGGIKVDSKLGEGTKVTITMFLELQDDDPSFGEVLENLPVLVVDDDKVSCESSVDTLKSIGMQGEWVNNGPAAVERVSAHHDEGNDYYAILLDWKMPGMDGLETARAIREKVGNNVPIVLLTAYDFGEVEDEARAAGVNYFVGKPLFRSRLKAALKHLGSGTKMAKPSHTGISPLPVDDYTGKRVLVVEDNELNREIMVELLGETNIEIDTAVNGKVAVEKVNDSPEGYYDLVFMDIRMPVMNGLEATSAIRALPNDKGATLPIIALTANAFTEDIIAAKNAGVNEHLAKPVDIDHIAEAMRTWIK